MFLENLSPPNPTPNPWYHPQPHIPNHRLGVGAQMQRRVSTTQCSLSYKNVRVQCQHNPKNLYLQPKMLGYRSAWAKQRAKTLPFSACRLLTRLLTVKTVSDGSNFCAYNLRTGPKISADILQICAYIVTHVLCVIGNTATDIVNYRHCALSVQILLLYACACTYPFIQSSDLSIVQRSPGVVNRPRWKFLSPVYQHRQQSLIC